MIRKGLVAFSSVLAVMMLWASLASRSGNGQSFWLWDSHWEPCRIPTSCARCVFYDGYVRCTLWTCSLARSSVERSFEIRGLLLFEDRPMGYVSNQQKVLWHRRCRTISVNPLPLIPLFAIWPTIAFIRGPYRRCRRRRKGLCLRCGYNLSGNVSGVCPECGERI